MDVVLFAASATLTAYLPRHVGEHDASSETRRSSVTVVLGLSLGLFSLSVLEALPTSWLLLLDHDTFRGLHHNGSFLTVTTAYRLLLWGLCLWLVVVAPTLVCAHLFEQLAALRETRHVDRDENKYPRTAVWRRWWIRYGLLPIFNILYRLVIAPCVQLLLRRTKNRQASLQADPVLPHTSTEDASPPARSPTSSNPKPKRRPQSLVLGSVSGFASTLVVLRALGPLVIQSASQEEEKQILATIISWLCAVGLLVSSVLNGFGSVSMPHSCLAGLYLEPIRPDVLSKAEEDLCKMNQALEAKRCEFWGVSSPSSISSAPSSSSRRRSPVGTAQPKKTFVDYQDDISQRKQALENDIEFFETMCEELREEVADMKYLQRTAATARTTMGRIRAWLGVTFSIVLLIRLCMAVLSIWKSYYVDDTNALNSRSDPITTALLWLMGHHLVSQQDYNTISQCISLLLTAFLSASQIRTFLRTVAAVNRRLSHAYRKCYCTKHKMRNPSDAQSFGSMSDVYWHLLGCLMGCYFLSCVVLTKMNLPLEYRSGFSDALGGMDFAIHAAVGNTAFVTSAFVSATTLGLLFGIQQQNTKRHATSAWADDTLGNLDAC